MSQCTALDLLSDVLQGWRHLFQNIPSFKSKLKGIIVPCIKPLLRNLREDYTTNLRQQSAHTNSMTTRVVRIVRCLLLLFLDTSFALEAEALISLMVHTLQPERGGSSFAELSALARQFPTFEDINLFHKLNRSEDSLGVGGHIMSRLTNAKPSPVGSSGPVMRSGVSGTGFLFLGSPGYSSGGGGSTHGGAGGPGAFGCVSTAIIPAHPAGVCLEALLSLLLSDGLLERFGSSPEGETALVVAMTSLSVTVTSLISEAFAIDSNVR